MATAREALRSAADQFEWESTQMKKSAGDYYITGGTYDYCRALDAAVRALRERSDDVAGAIKYTAKLLET
jgi:hypothetical protein